MSYLTDAWRELANYFRRFVRSDLPKGNSGRQAELGAALISPAYDPLTIRLSQLVDDLCQSEGLFGMRGDDASNSRLQEFLLSDGLRKKCIIFAGHGKSKFLLTAPTLGSRSEEFTGKHSILLDQSAIEKGAGLAVFAYACEAGLGMGSYARSVGVFFIGYDDDIPFVPNSDDTGFDPIFCEPVRIAVEDYHARGVLDLSTIERIRSFYVAAIAEMKPKKKDYRCRSIEWALRLHLELISV